MLTLFFIKLLVAISVVIGFSLIAEHASPRIAGVLFGYPTGTAITLFFFGLEVSPKFASESAIYNMLGIVAALSFFYFYYKASLRFNMVASSLFAIAGYFVLISLLHTIKLNLFLAVILPTLSIPIFIILFKSIQNIKITNKIKLSHTIILARAVCAASIILIVTALARVVGPAWSGLFSAFPTTVFPLVVIVHFTYGPRPVHTIIKNGPYGIFSLILYSLTVSITYPIYGIYWGTVVSFAVATLYLIIYELLRRVKNVTATI